MTDRNPPDVSLDNPIRRVTENVDESTTIATFDSAINDEES